MSLSVFGGVDGSVAVDPVVFFAEELAPELRKESSARPVSEPMKWGSVTHLMVRNVPATGFVPSKATPSQVNGSNSGFPAPRVNLVLMVALLSPVLLMGTVAWLAG